ncbi:MAG TPA: chlorite dismutase family protein [Phycisphaerae bacterium]|nr:chlorite dismutase family protein [Phycisphaerae bacterium]
MSESPSAQSSAAPTAPPHGHRPGHAPAPQGQRPASTPVRRQFVSFAFYKLQPEFRRIPEAHQRAMLNQFADLVEANDRQKMILLTYSCIGTRADVDIMFWKISFNLDDVQNFSAAINRLPIAGYLTTPHSFLAQTKRSTYIDKLDPSHDESRTVIKPGKHKYVFVYPFVKKREWYLLSKQARQGIMDEHIEIGNKYQSVRLNTTYSFGLDDQEFVVAFETEDPGDFLDLVQELRESEGSRYTERDTPIFTAVQTPIRELIKNMANI